MDRKALFDDIRIQLDAGMAWLKSHYPHSPVESELKDGSAVDVLVEASRHVELVVVGTRGRGGFTGMLLGSTSGGVLHHAKGPVLVVPDREDPRLADRASSDPSSAQPDPARHAFAAGGMEMPDTAVRLPSSDWRQSRAAMVPLVGGKAANLGELLAAGLPVPDGFCLTTEAYRQATAGGRGSLATLDGVPDRGADSPTSTRLCGNARRRPACLGCAGGPGPGPDPRHAGSRRA